MPSSRRLLLSAVLALAAGAALAAPATKLPPAPGDMSLGSPKARVQVVEYASLSCPHCARFNAEVFPAFRAKYVDTGKVRYTLREMLTPPAEVAAAGFLMARCAGPGKYFKVVDEVFRIIARLRQEGVTMLLVEQFAAAALNVADYGYVLENGRIAVHGPADKLKNDPAVKAAYLGGH